MDRLQNPNAPKHLRRIQFPGLVDAIFSGILLTGEKLLNDSVHNPTSAKSRKLEKEYKNKSQGVFHQSLGFKNTILRESGGVTR
jgi:hypothetical protein